MKNSTDTRRDFIKKSALGAIGLASTFTASSYAKILGANDRINIAVAIKIPSITDPTSFVKRIGEKVIVDIERDNET